MEKPSPRTLFFTKQVDQASIAELSQKIVEINDSDAYLIKEAELNGFSYTPSPISIYIDSYGGAVYQILGVVNLIESSKTPVHTICTGVAMSCGFILLINGHRRYCYKHSTPLYHQVSSTNYGTLKELNDELAEATRLQKILETITLSKTKITKARLQEVYEKKIDWYMTATEAKKLGVVDEIL